MPSLLPAVEVGGLGKSYGGRPVLRGVSFAAPTGAVTAVLGPNGAGKTTTIEMCEGYRRPDAGSVRVLGRDPRRDARDLRPRVGVMLQSGGIYPSLPARAVLRHFARLHAHPLDTDELSERLGLADLGRTPVRRLSGGQQQRLSLALAVVGRPELVFLDEPTSGLDPKARHATWDLMRDLRRDGVTIVLSTHVMTEVEELADHVVVLDRGAVAADGSLRDLMHAARRAEITFRAAPRLNVASLSSAVPGVLSAEEVRPGRYVVRAEVTPQVVAGVTAWCADQGVVPESLDTGSRTLEEVFLELTTESAGMDDR